MVRRILAIRIFGLILLIVLLAIEHSTALAGQNEWTSTGGPPGLIYAVVLDPVTPGIMYAGTSTGGVFKSTDEGRSWSPANQGLDTTGVLSLAINPEHPSTLYAGTNRGVYRTDDGAETWVAASDGIAQDPFGYSFVYALVIDHNQPSTAYAGTLQGIYKTQNNGRSWLSQNAGLRIGILPSVEAIAIDPTNSNILYVGASYQGLSSTVYKTEDGGDTWAPLMIGLSQWQISGIALDPANPRRVFVATRGQGLFASSDSGQNWHQTGQSVLESNIAAITVGGSPSMVFAAGAYSGFYRSADGGATWEQVEGNIGRREPTSIVMDIQAGSSIWLTSEGGLYLSNDQGSHWIESGRGIAASQIVNVVAQPANPRQAFVSAWAGGVYRTVDGGATWQAVPLGTGICSSLAVDPSDPNLAYAGMVYMSGVLDTGLYVSHDAGITWSLIPQFKEAVVSAIATAPGKVYLGTNAGVYVSEDSGASWRQANTGLANPGQVLDLAINPLDPSRLYLISESAPEDLYYSRDSGQTWSILHSFGQRISALSPSPASSGLLYIGGYSSVFKSADGGASWQEMSFSGNGTILTLEAHPLASNTLYLGSSQGAYRSRDGGNTWTLLGLQNEAVTVLSISPADPTQVYGGTYGKGLWSYTAAPSLSVQPGTLNFLAEPGGHTPVTSPLSILDESGGSYGWSIQAPSWLSVTPSSGVSLPVTVTASVNTTGLSVGSYEDTLTVGAAITNTANSPQTIPASLHFGPIKRQFMPLVAEGSSGW